jgi:hypothetical protein
MKGVMISKMPAWQPFLYFSNTLTLPSVSTSKTRGGNVKNFPEM